MLTFEDFQKIELKVGKVLAAERVEGSTKLLKLQIDLGEPRQILAGLGKVYTPEDLIGKEVVVVANLEVRTIMGLESQGMVLAASSEVGPIVLMPEKEVTVGSKIS